MKKCDNCGAVQSDDRIFCVDCGERLGRPMSKADEEAHDAALSDTLTGMAERTEDFYVNPAARVLGIISIIAAFALAVMLPILDYRIDRIQADYLTQMGAVQLGENSFVVDRGGDSVAMVTGSMRAPAARALESVVSFALIGLICFVMAALFLLIPQVMWWLETLRYRLWFDADPSPSFYATAVYAVIKYGCFGLGCVMLITVLVNLF